MAAGQLALSRLLVMAVPRSGVGAATYLRRFGGGTLDLELCLVSHGGHDT